MKIRPAVFATLLVLPAALHAQDFEWKPARTGSWFTAGNWNPGGPPSDTDTAVINAGGTAQITSGNAVASSLGIASTASSTGALTLSGGTLTTGFLGIGTGGTGSLTVSGGALVAVANPLDQPAITVGGAGTGTLTLASGSVLTKYLATVENHGTVNINGGTWSGQFDIAAGGTMNFNGGTLQEGTYNGATIQVGAQVSGTLNIDGGSWAAGIFAGPGATGGTVNIKSGSGTISDLELRNQSLVTVTGGSWTVGGDAFDVLGGSSLTIAGGTVSSNGAFVGRDALGSGTLTLSSDATLSVPIVRLFVDGATLNIGAFDLANATTAGVLQASMVGFDRDSGDGTRVINFNQTNSITFQPVIARGGNAVGTVVQRGSGLTLLDKANVYTGGTTITGGYLVAGNNSALGTGGVTVNGGQLRVMDGITIANAITTGATGGEINNYGSYAQAAFTGPITLGGPLSISALSDASARTTVTGGITGTGNVVLGNWDSAALEISGAVVNPAGQLSHIGGGTGSATVSAVIGANVTGVIQNSATSPLILTGANLYTGPTTVSSGLLLANNTVGSATGLGAVLVQAVGTLGGTGIIGGDTVISGALAPGNGVGTLTFITNLTLNSGSSTNIELGGLAPGAFDSLSVDSTLTYGGTLSLSLVNGFTPQIGDTFEIFRDFNAFFGSFSSVTFSDPSIVGQFAPSSGTLSVVAIPEPSSILLVGIGVFVFVRRRKRTHSTA
jgi:autotransporter-associated beta strand protein